MREVLRKGLIIALLMEAVTVGVRFGGHVSASEFNKTAPLALQIHHMFWGIPLAALALMVLRWNRRAAEWLGALAFGCVVSDLSHHFLVLPLLVGNTGWHWP